jgi:hypothetical protein
MSLLVLIFYVSILIVIIKYLYRRDIFISFYVIALTVYSVMPSIADFYYPEIAQDLDMYYGNQIVYYGLFFTLLSIIFFVVLIKNCLGFDDKGINITVNGYKNSRFILFILFILSFYLILYYLKNYSNLMYGMDLAQVHSNYFSNINDFSYLIFSLIYKFLVPIILMIENLLIFRKEYCLKSKTIFIFRVNFLILLTVFILISFNIGNRTDIVSLLLGNLGLYLYRNRFIIRRKINYLGISIVAIVTYFIIYYLRIFRNPNYDDSISNFTISILNNDYFPPFHMLLTAINYEVIDPIFTFTSNLGNSLIMMNIPYLQEKLQTIIRSQFSRNTGYAFYSLGDGYMMMGFLGFIYNALILNIIFRIFRKFYTTNNYSFNAFMVSILCCQSINLTRCQFSYFLKDIYMIFIPCMTILFFTTGLRLKLWRNSN